MLVLENLLDSQSHWCLWKERNVKWVWELIMWAWALWDAQHHLRAWWNGFVIQIQPNGTCKVSGKVILTIKPIWKHITGTFARCQCFCYHLSYTFFQCGAFSNDEGELDATIPDCTEKVELWVKFTSLCSLAEVDDLYVDSTEVADFSSEFLHGYLLSSAVESCIVQVWAFPPKKVFQKQLIKLFLML